MVSGVRLAFGFLALVITGSAHAQGDLDQGKTAAQLYASACATCHKSPQSVAKTKWFFGLESFLRQHYTSTSESAAILAVYLKNQATMSADSARGRSARHVTQVPSQVSTQASTHVSTQVSSPTVNEFGEAIPRPPADIPDAKP
jgi:hypothetical protein